jgi:class 3 adenylate cyclase/tetratricopeptide (TPR) repeat protein
MDCPTCGGDNPDGKRFCADCGAPLLAACSTCGAQLLAGKRFCGDCGSPVGAATVLPASPAAPDVPSPAPAHPLPGPVPELRHVSVLFCDIAGFTPFAESKDPADVREFLSGYFDLARAVVTRYGGVVEKFIGDAVMAVWGVPTANEDDAERAVRAGLELLESVASYGDETGVDLSARVGIVTGRTATIAAADEGLVVGDRVNTAARIQAAAPPGSCFVDETTRAATSSAIAYAERGMHELKGKTEPVRLYEALRITAAIGGSQRASGVEAPFTGREHELRLLKELFQASAERSSARLALVSGVAGIGKSRLSWELFKYVDGLAQNVLWHSGRCLSYGEGISYWALSEMVRARLGIGETDPDDVVAQRLVAGLERWIPSAEDREFIAPRLGQLLGQGSPVPLVKEELFAGWRLFFERLSEHAPVVMVVEDLQWADPGLVQFIDQLLDWSADHPIFVLVLTRPEGADRPGLVLSRRNTTTLSLDPLSDEAIGQLLDALVVDFSSDARRRIVERAEGVPLYALETVRALLDRGVLEASPDGALHAVGEVGELDIPPELTALISSRLDGLGPAERQLVKECAVLGDSFPRHAVEAVTDLDRGAVDELLAGLVRREILTVRTDKLSPERGQYAFTQSLIRSVAYDTLTTSERKARHLRTVAHLQSAFSDEGADVAEVVAAHLFDAYRAAKGDADEGEFRRRAEDAALAAGERAEAVGSDEAAERAFLRAADLADDDLRAAAHLVRAAEMAFWQEANGRSIEHADQALSAYTAAGDIAGAARATVFRMLAMGSEGRLAEAIELGRRALDALDGLERLERLEPVVAELKAILGVDSYFTGDLEAASDYLDDALALSQRFELPRLLARSMHFSAAVLAHQGRLHEARLFYEESLALTKAHTVRFEAIGENNFAWFLSLHDLPGAEEHARAAIAVARRRGLRKAVAGYTDTLMLSLMSEGQFSQAELLGSDVISDEVHGSSYEFVRARLACVEAYLGRVEQARELFGRCEAMSASERVQDRGMHALTEATVAWALGDHVNALDAALRALAISIDEEGGAGQGVREGLPLALDAALALGRTDDIAAPLDRFRSVPPGSVPPLVKAHLRRADALISASKGATDGVEEALENVERAFAGLGYRYWHARAQLDLAEWLARRGDQERAHALAASAAEVFKQLGTVVDHERAMSLLPKKCSPSPEFAPPTRPRGSRVLSH